MHEPVTTTEAECKFLLIVKDLFSNENFFNKYKDCFLTDDNTSVEDAELDRDISEYNKIKIDNITKNLNTFFDKSTISSYINSSLIDKYYILDASQRFKFDEITPYINKYYKVYWTGYKYGALDLARLFYENLNKEYKIKVLELTQEIETLEKNCTDNFSDKLDLIDKYFTEKLTKSEQDKNIKANHDFYIQCKNHEDNLFKKGTTDKPSDLKPGSERISDAIFSIFSESMSLYLKTAKI